ncbi:MAG: thioredoxin domain-containing protein [Candidatus Moranbacteria bacterium]|nr:thioredoxin domain-containing protein [Candidatus Moranbacteria bacterium]
MEEEKKIKEAEILKEELENQEEEIFVEKEQSVEELLISSVEEKEHKIKNLISGVILLTGLFVGSLFVDIIQLMRGGGFSQHALESTEVFQSSGKTWVAYSEPIVTVKVVTDSSCGDACRPDEVLVGLKGALPTMLTEKIEADSAEGKKMISQLKIKSLPSFVFSKEIEKTELFSKAQPFLEQQGDLYVIKSAEAGFPIGKYVVSPEVSQDDIKFGPDDSKIKLVVFSYLQNPADKKFYQEIISPIMKEYGNNVQVVFKNYYPASSTQGAQAAMAGKCANAQGKFLPYAEKLFATQAVWGKLKDANSVFKGYAATLRLNLVDFGKCLDSKQFQSQLESSLKEGQSFGIQATPAMFIGSDLQVTTATYEEIKNVLDQQLK